MQNVEIFVDGTVMNNQAGWAYVILDQEEIICENGGVLKGDINKMRNVAGELAAVAKAVKYCKEKEYKATIVFDYIGIYQWVCDFFEPELKPWKRNNKWTERYREVIMEHKDYINKFVWQRGHQKDDSRNARWNSHVDELTRKYHKQCNENKSKPDKQR